MLVPGGWWKASRLCGGEYALVSEAVAPGFDYADNEIATDEIVRRNYPEMLDVLNRYIRQRPSEDAGL